MSEVADSSAAAAAVTPAKPRVIIHKDEKSLLRSLYAEYLVAVAADDPVVAAAQGVDSEEGTTSRSPSTSLPSHVRLIFSVKGALDYILPFFLLKFPDPTRALSTCNITRMHDLIKEQSSTHSASASSAWSTPRSSLAGDVPHSGSAAPPLVSPAPDAKALRLLRILQESIADANALKKDLDDASSLLSSLKNFSSRELSVIRDRESDEILGSYERADAVAKRLEDRSTQDASAASLPLVAAMSGALRKAVNCGWGWASDRDDENQKQASLSFTSVMLVPDSAAGSLKKKALESDPHRGEREALSKCVSASRRSEKVFFEGACRNLMKAIERDKEAASGFSQLVRLYHTQKASKRGRGSQLAVVSEESGSSSASAVSAADMATTAAAAGVAAETQRTQVLAELKQNVAGVVRNIRFLSDSCGRDRSKTSALCILFSSDSGSTQPFFCPTRSSLPAAIVNDAVSFEHFCQNALLDMAGAMFGCDEPNDTGDAVRPKRDDRVYTSDDFKEKKKNSGETKGEEAGTVETKGGEEEGDQMEEEFDETLV
jgi:hypothetical protein